MAALAALARTRRGALTTVEMRRGDRDAATDPKTVTLVAGSNGSLGECGLQGPTARTAGLSEGSLGLLLGHVRQVNLDCPHPARNDHQAEHPRRVLKLVSSHAQHLNLPRVVRLAARAVPQIPGSTFVLERHLVVAGDLLAGSIVWTSHTTSGSPWPLRQGQRGECPRHAGRNASGPGIR